MLKHGAKSVGGALPGSVGETGLDFSKFRTISRVSFIGNASGSTAVNTSELCPAGVTHVYIQVWSYGGGASGNQAGGGSAWAASIIEAKAGDRVQISIPRGTETTLRDSTATINGKTVRAEAGNTAGGGVGGRASNSLGDYTASGGNGTNRNAGTAGQGPSGGAAGLGTAEYGGGGGAAGGHFTLGGPAANFGSSLANPGGGRNANGSSNGSGGDAMIMIYFLGEPL